MLGVAPVTTHIHWTLEKMVQPHLWAFSVLGEQECDLEEICRGHLVHLFVFGMITLPYSNSQVWLHTQPLSNCPKVFPF